MSAPVAKFLAASSAAVVAALGGSWLSRRCCCCYLMLQTGVGNVSAAHCPHSLLLQLSQLHPHNHGLNNVGLYPPPSPASSACCPKPVCARLPSSFPPSVCVCLCVCAIVCMHIKFNRMYSLYSMLASLPPCTPVELAAVFSSYFNVTYT